MILDLYYLIEINGVNCSMWNLSVAPRVKVNLSINPAIILKLTPIQPCARARPLQQSPGPLIAAPLVHLLYPSGGLVAGR